MTSFNWKPGVPVPDGWRLVDTPLRQRFEFPFGWFEGDVRPSRLVDLGDRRVPRRLHAHYFAVDGQPSLDLDLEVVDGRPQCREVRITSTDGGREVKPIDIRWVELTKRITETYAWFTGPQDDGVMVIKNPSNTTLRENRHRIMRARKGKTARKLTPDFFRKVATIYNEHIEGGSPTKAVREAFDVSSSQANNYVRAARKLGLITPRT